MTSPESLAKTFTNAVKRYARYVNNNCMYLCYPRCNTLQDFVDASRGRLLRDFNEDGTKNTASRNTAYNVVVAGDIDDYLQRETTEMALDGIFEAAVWYYYDDIKDTTTLSRAMLRVVREGIVDVSNMYRGSYVDLYKNLDVSLL